MCVSHKLSQIDKKKVLFSRGKSIFKVEIIFVKYDRQYACHKQLYSNSDENTQNFFVLVYLLINYFIIYF